MSPNAKKLRGGQYKTVTDGRGRVIEGLGSTPIKGTSKFRYYVQDTKPIKWLGSNLPNAIAKLERWKLSHNPTGNYEDIRAAVPPLNPDGSYDETVNPVVVKDILADRRYLLYSIPSDALWERFAELVAADPEEAQKRLGVRFANPEDLPRSIPLGSPADDASQKTAYAYWRYGKRSKPLGMRWARECGKIWENFCKRVGVSRLDQLDKSNVDKFYNWATSPDNRFSDDYVSNLFGAVIAVVKSAAKWSKCPVAARTYNLLKTELIAPESQATGKIVSDSNALPVSREGFGKILAEIRKADDLKMECVVTLALNAALYPYDCETLQLSDIDFERTILANRRTKTKVERVVCLWTETVDLLKRYLASDDYAKRNPDAMQPGQRKYAGNLFGWHYKRFGKQWLEYRRAAGVDESIGFNSLRDTALTIAGSAAILGDERNLDVARIIAGHKFSGQIDAYYKRSEAAVRDACEAIRVEMIGEKGQDKPKSRGKTTGKKTAKG